MNTPTGVKLITPSSDFKSGRLVKMVRSAPCLRPAAAIVRMVRATPFTSSSVSVHQPFRRFSNSGGRRPVILWATSAHKSRFTRRA